MSQGPLQHILYPIRSFLRSSAYREFLRLLARYGRAKRYSERQIRCLHFNLQVPDPLSFIFQFKDIFVEEHYRFSCATPSPRIIDCGANIGISCLYFKTLFPSAVITAYEADPNIAAVLEKNLRNNFYPDITIVPKAVWTHNNGIEFAADGADAGSVYGSLPKVPVLSTRLATVLANEQHVDFLKMDIEGAEIEVIADCASVLERIDRLYIEYHAWKNGEQALDELLSQLKSSGFRYYIQSVSEIPTPLGLDETIFHTDLQLHIFAIHSRLSQQ